MNASEFLSFLYMWVYSLLSDRSNGKQQRRVNIFFECVIVGGLFESAGVAGGGHEESW